MADETPGGEGSPPSIQFTPDQFRQFMRAVQKAATEAATRGANIAAALVLDHFAKAIASAGINTTPPAARPAVESALRAVADEARRMAQAVRAGRTEASDSGKPAG